MLGKQELDTQNNSILQRELDNLLDTLARHSSEIDYTIITYVHKRRKTSALVLFKKCDNCEEEILEEYKTIQELATSIAPHIVLQLVKPTKDLIPMPNSFGNIAYARVFDRVYDSPKSEDNNIDFDIELGTLTTPELSSVPVGIRTSDVFRHIGIFGTTGSGKSNTASIIASQLLEKGFNVVILDWHGEYIERSKNFKVLSNDSLVKLNILKFNSIDDTVEILSDVLQLTDPQRFMLYILLMKLKKYPSFNLKSFISVLSQIESTSNWSKEVKMALARKMYPIFTAEGKKIFASSDSNDITTLLQSYHGIIVNLSSIKNIKLRKIYSLFLIKLITDLYMDNKQAMPIILIIEEAHNYFSTDNDFTNKLISEVRKFGVGLCIVTQSPSSISPEVMKNTNIKIIHSIKSDLDKHIISDSMSLSSNLVNIMDKLDPGDAILSAPNIKQPIIIKINKINYI
ncbi:ATPase [Acidianus manzaensis]|uniref:ATPase n=1 Tax=Acidianus manzaensis TaxID=282676 RepID=A0A1W6K3T8_9CREN|nr:ATPase [Acidianus manzaensis]